MLARPQEGPHSGLEGYVAATATIHFTANNPKLVRARIAENERRHTRDESLVSREGIEPSTYRLRVCCSAN